jgi:hypothetical protein
VNAGECKSPEKEMNDRQKLAFRFPCRRGPETTHQRFWSLNKVNGRLFSTILTVDTFNPHPMWHASVAVLPSRKLSAATKRIAIATAKVMLAGVGQGTPIVDQTEVAIHYQRSLTDEELAGLRKR